MLTEVLGATREEMRDAKLPLAYRDSCAHLLIPLNRCRVDSYYLPWKCTVSTSRPPDERPCSLPYFPSISPSTNRPPSAPIASRDPRAELC